MIMRTPQNEDDSIRGLPDAPFAEWQALPGIDIYQYVPLDPNQTKVRLHQSHSGLRPPHLLRSETRDHASTDFVNSTMYLG